jgi:hypothetical protein
MLLRNKPLLFLSALLMTCQLIAQKADLPSDKKATKETARLYQNLKKQLGKGFMFGHQDDLAYGVGWKYETGRSDIKDVTGDYPAVYGWELGHLELDHLTNLDSVPFDRMKQLIEDGYKRGGVITISWHMDNPLTGRSAWNPETGTVASVLEGGSKNALYKSWLDKVANFLNGLKGSKGEYIPVIFRPFHELNGNWFWWGGKNSTVEEFKQLWIMTVSYLRDVKKVHHLLIAYNTDRYNSKEEYLAKYPGNEWVDIVGFDIYQRDNAKEKYWTEIGRMLTTLEEVATEKNKIPALTEFGGNLSDSNWWTDTFLPAIGTHKIAYALGWRNAGIRPNGGSEFYVPYKGHATSKDFVRFYKADRTLFQKDVSKQKLYQ